MPFDLAAFKKHPYVMGGAVLIGAVVLFLLLRRQQSSQSASSGASIYGLQSNLAQINAASQMQAYQTQAQLQQTQLQAQVANNQQVYATQIAQQQNDAQLVVALENLRTGLQTVQVNAAAQTTQQANQLMYAQNIQAMQDAVLSSQINAGVREHLSDNETQLAQYGIAADYATVVAGLQHDIATKNIANSYNLNQQVISNIKNVGGSQNRVSLLESASGNYAGAIAAEYGQTASSISGDNFLSNLMRSISGVASSAVNVIH